MGTIASLSLLLGNFAIQMFDKSFLTMALGLAPPGVSCWLEIKGSGSFLLSKK